MASLLFVDDDPFALQLYRKMAELLGHSVLAAGTAGEAAALLLSTQPDLAFVDHNLPDCTGLELVAQLRLRSETAGLPVLILSAGSGGDDLQTALQGGAHGFLNKPLSFTALAEAVQTYIPQPQ